MLKISKRHLFSLAGILWLFAGFQIVRIGVITIPAQHLPVACIGGGALIIFIVFFRMVFLKMVKKHTLRIRSMINEKQPFYLFFDKKSYIIMFCMMSGGILLRSFHILPEFFIAFFYTGLGAALFICGILYLNAGIDFKRSIK